MSNCLRIALALTLICLSLALTLAQRRSRIPSKGNAGARQPTAALAFPPRRDFNHSGHVETTFDKFDNRTSVSIETNIGTVLDLHASFAYAGDKLLRPPISVALIFETYSSARLGVIGENFIRNREIVLLADGRVIRQTGIYQAGSYNPDNSYRYEYLATELPLRTFLTIVSARSVSAKVAGSEVEFTDENLEALRDLASRMNPQAQEQPALSVVAAPTPTPSPIPPRAASDIIGTWMLQVTAPDNQSATLTLIVRQERGGLSCVIEGGGERRSCTATGNSFTFLLPNVPVSGQVFDCNYSGSAEGKRIAGKVLISNPSGISITLPLTGTWIAP
jgi:hypothetical protein